MLVIFLAALLALFIGWRRARARSAYRRAGLRLLVEARTAREVDVVLKRVALAAFPRSRVASLYGGDWAAFLDGTCPRTRFADLDPSDADGAAPAALRDLAGIWIRHHRVAAESLREGGV